MEEQWVIDRAYLRQLLQEHPNWITQQYMEATGRSYKWVKKWKKRLVNADPNDDTVLRSRSRARQTPPKPYHPDVISRILDLRDHPPEAVPRKIGPRTILYYLHQDETLKVTKHALPRSGSTIWKILDVNQRIIRPSKKESIPFDRPEPMDTWEIDFTDVGTAQARHDRKQQHQVEAFAVMDRGTSMLVDLQASDEYHARTSLLAMASTLIQHGIPRCIVFDRDPRLIGSWSADKFPSAFMRFLLDLGITLDVCPPQRPDLKPFVERYFRTLDEECIQQKCPENLTQTQDVFKHHHYTYNHLRPHQSSVCGNRPPSIAFAKLPTLAHLPQTVDPNRWLNSYHRHVFKRRVNSSGRIQIGKQMYYIQRKLAGRYIVCQLDAKQSAFQVTLDNKLIKTLPIKGLCEGEMDFGDYLEMRLEEAVAEQRRLKHKRRIRNRQVA